MQGILIVAHGSRAKQTLQTMEAVADMVRKGLPKAIIQVGYMEFCEVNIEKGLSLLLAQGVTDIRVVPYFLFDGIHIREDIPAELAAFQQAHPQVRISIAPSLGPDKRLAEILVERITG